MHPSELKSDQLYQHCRLEELPFATTDDFDERVPLPRLIGQPRAQEALTLGIGIRRDGYNIFALGENGTGKFTFIRSFLKDQAARAEVPPDICYVNNFEERHKPRLLTLKAGHGKMLSQDMNRLVENIRSAMRAALENEEYQNRSQSIAHEFQEKQKEAFDRLRERAREYGLMALRTPGGLAFAPARGEEAISPEDYNALPEAERRRIEANAEEMQKEAQRIAQRVPQWQREAGEKQKNFNREVTEYTVDPLVDEIKRKYADHAAVSAFIQEVRDHIVENVRALFARENVNPQVQQLLAMAGGAGQPEAGDAEGAVLRQYQVNVLVDHAKQSGAPVVHEENPTYQNLFGRVEHLAQMGALITDFNMIRAGAVHRANGGYLLLDALKVVRDPFAWEGLKRTLRSGQVKIESLGQAYSLISTVSLDPQPLPLDVKVVLIGSPMIYYLLRQHDPEFAELFKVPADFDHQMDRSQRNQHEYARLIAAAVRDAGLRPFGRDAVARVIERASRTAGDTRKLSLQLEQMKDLLREADYWADRNAHAVVGAADVDQAVEAWVYRSDRLRERMQEQIERDIVLIDTQGVRVGQINGLSVISLGDFYFGRPSRITARVRLGKGEVIDIEREVAMGGPIHSKGVLILSGFLGGRYAADTPLSLSASLVFEQSYGGVEGDSASSAELYALLSAISGVPIRQSLAVTGSVDQYGRVQPIGGANEKIEGFFDVCRAKGLNGDQGVLIPASNVQHLMLRRDVIEAVQDGRFHIYAVETIDQGIEILTGVPAGEAHEGQYPQESINGKVHRRLVQMAETGRRFMQHAGEAREKEAS